MKKVTGQYKQEYVLDLQSEQSTAAGTSYRIQGNTELSVHLLEDNSKSRQLEIEQKIQEQSFDGEFLPREIVYSRGRFVGYTYSNPSYAPPDEPDIADSDQNEDAYFSLYHTSHFGTDSIAQKSMVKILATIVIGIVLYILGVTVVQKLYENILLEHLSNRTVLELCIKGSAGGISASVGGIVLLGIVAYINRYRNLYLLISIEIGCFCGGVLFVDAVITIAIIFVKLMLPIIIEFLIVAFMIALVLWLIWRAIRS